MFGKPPTTFQRYAVAVVAVSAAFGLRYGIYGTLDHRIPFAFFTVSTLVAAWYGGLGPGMLAALAGLLAGDDAGYAIVCADGTSPPDRAAFAELACSSAEHDRQERAIERLLADPVALDASCAANPTYEQGLTLVLACDRRRADKDRPAIEPALRVAADAPIHDPPERNIFHPESALNRAARPCV